MHRSSQATRVFSAIALSAVAIGGIALLPGVPVAGLLPGLPPVSALDYQSRPVNGLAPLSGQFIRRVLGVGQGNSLDSARAIGAATRSGAALESGERVTEVHPLTNDDIADARDIPAVPFTAKTDTRKATREPNEPDDCSPVGNSTVWYRYTPSQSIGLIANTFGSDYSTTLGVFQGRPGSLSRVGCDTDASGNAVVGFVVKQASTYYFQITGRTGGGGLVFNLDPQGKTSLVSQPSSGDPAEGGSGLGTSISANGRYIAFSSNAANLAKGVDSTPCGVRDPVLTFAVYGYGPCPQIYLHDVWTGRTELISATSSGESGNSASLNPFVSTNGRYVTYESAASNIEGANAHTGWDIFVFDRVTRRTERVPVTSSPSNSDFALEQLGSFFQQISDDGRYVLFQTWKSDLVPGDTNASDDVFVYDRLERRVERQTVSSSGAEMRGRTRGLYADMYPSMSADGRYVEFLSDSPTLVSGDTNGVDDVFLHDRLTRRTERISVSRTGEQANERSWIPGPPGSRLISNDGRWVAFSSFASNLVPDDTNNGPDVFVRDRLTGTTVRVSLSSAGAQISQSEPYAPFFISISGNGRYIAFDSNAANVVPDDVDSDWDVFVHDLVTRTTTLVTLTQSGENLSGQSPAISADGRAVAYVSGLASDRADAFTVGGQVFVYRAPDRR